MTFFSPVSAMLSNPVIPSGNGQTGIQFFASFIPRMISLLFMIGGLAFFFMLLIGGIRWVTAGGDKGSVESARAQITQAVAGLFIMVSVWAISRFMQSVFGISILNVDFAPLLPGTTSGTPSYP